MQAIQVDQVSLRSCDLYKRWHLTWNVYLWDVPAGIAFLRNCSLIIQITFAGIKLSELVLLLYPTNWNFYLHLDWESFFNQGPWSSRQNAGVHKCNLSLFLQTSLLSVQLSNFFICSQHGNQYQWGKGMNLIYFGQLWVERLTMQEEKK